MFRPSVDCAHTDADYLSGPFRILQILTSHATELTFAGVIDGDV